jgi:hypothetical protein
LTSGALAAETVPGALKRTAVLRRVPPSVDPTPHAVSADEGCVGVFELAANGVPITVEAVSGRAMTLVPGDRFLAAPGHRESTRWVVGGIPAGGLLPGREYWVLSDSGIVGALEGESPLAKNHLGRARYLGAVLAHGKVLALDDFALRPAERATDRGAPVFLVLGTAAEVGKTTAGLAILRSLLQRGHRRVAALKATGRLRSASSPSTATSAPPRYWTASILDCRALIPRVVSRRRASLPGLSIVAFLSKSTR